MAVEAGGIGARLRAGREKLGLTVLQVAERIHTDAKIVEAIEAENFDALGAPVYARGHIRHLEHDRHLAARRGRRDGRTGLGQQGEHCEY